MIRYRIACLCPTKEEREEIFRQIEPHVSIFVHTRKHTYYEEHPYIHYNLDKEISGLKHPYDDGSTILLSKEAFIFECIHGVPFESNIDVPQLIQQLKEVL
jgi:hypothetical protein